MATKVKDKAASAAGSDKHIRSLVSSKKLQQLYSAMLKCRMLDERVCTLAPALSNGHRSVGRHEAAAVGVTIDLRKEDVIASAHYAHTASFVKGVPLATIFGQFHAKKKALQNGHSPLASGVIASGPGLESLLQITTGAAVASKLQKDGHIAVAFMGGVPSALDAWHNALKLAGNHKLPIIFVAQNSHREEDDLSAQALQYGLPCIPVDAADVVAVYRVAFESITRVRQGNGPTLIECKSYPQNRASNLKDPLETMEQHLAAKGLFSDSWKRQLITQFSKELNAATRSARS